MTCAWENREFRKKRVFEKLAFRCISEKVNEHKIIHRKLQARNSDWEPSRRMRTSDVAAYCS